LWTQEERLSKFCQRQDWSLHDQSCDPGVSAQRLSRPGLQELLGDGRQRAGMLGAFAGFEGGTARLARPCKSQAW
jgi:DNA invertase Pin-like site-specific DNA recombinase